MERGNTGVRVMGDCEYASERSNRQRKTRMEKGDARRVEEKKI